MLTNEFKTKIETVNALQILEKQAKKNQEDGIPLVALHTECALKLAQDALALLTAEPTSTAPVGTINTNKYALCTCVDLGTTKDGKEYEICVQLNHAPFVRYGNKTFNLSWNDVVTLAERAGLFNDEVAE